MELMNLPCKQLPTSPKNDRFRQDTPNPVSPSIHWLPADSQAPAGDKSILFNDLKDFLASLIENHDQRLFLEKRRFVSYQINVRSLF